MKKMKKFIALLLMGTLIGSTFMGCTNKNGENKKSSDEGKAVTKEESPSEKEATKAEQDNQEEPYEVLMEIVTFGQDYRDIPAIEAAVNEIILPEINCTIKFLNTSISDRGQKLNMKIAGGEKLDLIVSGLTTPLVNDGSLLPLDDLLEANGGKLKEILGDFAAAGQIDGVTYAVAGDLYPAKGRGLVYDKQFAADNGIEFPDYPTYEELEAIFEIVKQKGNGMYGATGGDGSMTSSMNYYNVDGLGDNTKFTRGAIINPESNTEIVNWFATEEYREYLGKMREWLDKGYLTPDSMTSGVIASDMLKAKTLFCLGSSYELTQPSMWTNNMGYEVAFAQTVKPTVSTDAVREVMWGIPITSERPEKVMEFLTLMYENGEVANLISNGIEGLNYKKVSEHIITHADDVDITNLGYQRIFSKFGDTLKVKQWEPATEAFFDDLKTFNESAKLTKTLGYSFDVSSLSAELAAVTNVIAEHMPALECGKVDIDLALPKFLAALDEAGYDKIIEENQRQLDAWLATK